MYDAITAAEPGTVMRSIRRTSLVGASVGWGVLAVVAAIAFIVDTGFDHTDGPVGRAVPPNSSLATSSASKPPLTLAEYQAVLTSVEQAIRPAMDRVVAATTLAEIDSARIDLAAILQKQWDYLQTITPPYQAREQHRGLETTVFVWDRLQKNVSSADVTKSNSCGIEAAQQAQVYEAKQDVYRAMKSSSYKTAVEGLAELNLKFGELMLPAEPVAPPVTDRRAANGEIIQRTGRRGSGRLRINNGDISDVAVSVTNGNPSNPQVTIYVRGSSSATITGITGTYWVYFKSGGDWDAARHGFTRDCSFEKFDLPFDQASDWEISLEETPAGNATTTTVSPF
ncbi:hypothetical protein FDG2_1736 [Candidatus Protofrankia californiensis]|uniref:Uncharacterized protein n=1 Tax=Candidatus Protofrankia californiensis TaxID=1839754 RepID=A0A1C3NWB7_9ACTN|nr:hypothetical protein FDG2_1736 [Candidatus Protofrankia californiensis]